MFIQIFNHQEEYHNNHNGLLQLTYYSYAITTHMWIIMSLFGNQLYPIIELPYLEQDPLLPAS